MSPQNELLAIAKKYKRLATLQADPMLKLCPTTVILPPGYDKHIVDQAKENKMPINTFIVVLLASACGSGRVSGFPEAEVRASSRHCGKYSSLRLPPILIQQMKHLADVHETTSSQLVTNIITHYLARKGIL